MEGQILPPLLSLLPLVSSAPGMTSQLGSQAQLGWSVGPPYPLVPQPTSRWKLPSCHVPSPRQLLSSKQQLSKTSITAIQHGNVHQVFPRIKNNNDVFLIDSRSPHPMNEAPHLRKCTWMSKIGRDRPVPAFGSGLLTCSESAFILAAGKLIPGHDIAYDQHAAENSHITPILSPICP